MTRLHLSIFSLLLVAGTCMMAHSQTAKIAPLDSLLAWQAAPTFAHLSLDYASFSFAYEGQRYEFYPTPEGGWEADYDKRHCLRVVSWQLTQVTDQTATFRVCLSKYTRKGGNPKGWFQYQRQVTVDRDRIVGGELVAENQAGNAGKKWINNSLSTVIIIAIIWLGI